MTPTPATRRLTPRGDATRRRILKAARDLIHHRGVAATSIGHILADAKAGKGQFYHYFADKEGLIEAVVCEDALALHTRLEGHLVASGDGMHGVVAWLRDHVRIAVEEGLTGGCPIGSVAAEVADRNEALRERLSDAFDTLHARLSNHFRALERAGRLGPVAPGPCALASEVLSGLQGGLLLARTCRRRALLDHAVDGLVRRLTELEIRPPAHTP
ncbi:MAG: TetR/AcrR family transcriptional regulator [Longimicrobiales bacterium]|nr:TetR/AcrR family transcriptional regulator [Longimicrobiales bacterium]